MPLTDSLSEAELLRLACAGDEPAFAALYERCKGSVYRYVLHMTASPELAEDLTHDAFLTLIAEAEKFDERRGQLLSFLLGITHNLIRHACRDTMRQTPLVETHEDGEEVELVLASADDTMAQVLQGEAVDLVREAVQSLPPHYREVVVLCDLLEISYAEASAQLDCNLGTIRSRLNRAHGLLAKKLAHRVHPAHGQNRAMIQGDQL